MYAICKHTLAFVLLLILAAGAWTAQAQVQVTVTGQVVDSEGTPLAYANVQLLVYADSSRVAGTMAAEDGTFILKDISPGNYRIYVSLIGFKPHFSERLRLTGSSRRRVEPIMLTAETAQMKELSVRARRTLYEQKSDRLVVNVGTGINLSGVTVLDVLERSPGVRVNEQAGTISMLGKDGVQVMVNDKPRYIPREALIQFLAGTSADNLERIELITSPPAALDAEGNAGFIHLVLKDNPVGGVNGSFSASGGYGEGQLGNTSANLNCRHPRVTINGSYSFLWNGQQEFIRNFRRISSAGDLIEMLAETRRDPIRRNHNANLAIDYEINPRTTLGALLGAYHNRFSMDAVSLLHVRSNGMRVSDSRSEIDLMNQWRHLMGNVNLRHKLDSVNSISVDVDYLQYHNRMPTENFNTSTNVLTGAVTEQRLSSGKITPLGIFAAKSDYRSESFENWELGAGVKVAFSRFTNEPTFLAPVENNGLTDIGVSGTTHLRENLIAAYGHGIYQATEAASVEVGLRYEYTISSLKRDNKQEGIERRYGHFFPSVIYTHQLGDGIRFSASYTRRITRPAFNDLASFSRYDDPYAIATGNMGLEPAIVNRLKFNFTYRKMLASIEYAWEDSTITRFQSRLLPRTNIQLISPMNFPGTQTATVLLGGPVRLSGWWSAQNSLMLIWKEVDGFRNHLPVTVSKTSVRVTSTQNIRLPHNFAFEASGFYQSGTLLGTMRYGRLWRIDLGLQRALPGGNGTLTLSANNLFNSMGWSWRMGSQGDRLFVDQYLDLTPRAVRLTYTLRFGGETKARERSTAAAEESGRVQP